MILVTGAAGYIGGYLINKLLEDDKFADYDIVGIDNFIVGYRDNYNLIKKDKRVKLLEGDITDRNFLKNLMRDVEIVYHLAAISYVDICNNHPELAFRINVEGTLNLLEESVKNSVEYFVFPSSAAVYGNVEGSIAKEDMKVSPLNKYGAMKASCEALCNAYYNSYGLKTVVLRFTNIYGVGTYPKWGTVVANFIRRALNNEPLIIHGSGEQKRDFIHIDDVVELYKLVVLRNCAGEIFNAGSGYSASIKELAELVSKIAEEKGFKTEIRFVEKREAKERRFSYDVSKVKEKLNFSPKHDIESGIRKTFSDIERILKNGFKEYQKKL